ncbi:hypothetical protein NA57DRAFT_81002 [Rhizodiscina lignyota]|uniref:DUF7223 domain-containing protein n=1 Tax=Rhizodiscina lignyota TaxID=1504668 RepID=A0A9P4M5N3_9PEZI|nr:hypothetical protein NA57DRAFT_81002 [Rhizodiscina lignyota]
MSVRFRLFLLTFLLQPCIWARSLELPDVDWRTFPYLKFKELSDATQVHTRENGFSFTALPAFSSSVVTEHRVGDPLSNAATSLGKHNDLRRRQAISGASSSNSSVLPANLTSVPFKAPPAQNFTSNRTTNANLGFELIDHEFSDLEQLLRPHIPLTFSCKNCSTTGSMILTRGEFNFTNTTELAEEVLNNNDPVRIFESGSIEMQINDFSAHIELETGLSKSFGQKINLFSAPLFGLDVPGFGKLGVFFQVPLIASMAVSGGVQFTYGFDVTVPNNSSVFIDFTNISNSRTTGFDHAQITAIPFQANITAVDLTANLVLEPAVLVGFDFAESAVGTRLEAKAEAGVFLALPSLTAKFETLATVDENCNSAANLSSSHLALLDQLGNLTHITPSVEVELGVEAQFALAVDSHAKALNFPNTLLSASKTLPTACLAFDKGASTFAPANVLYTSLSLAAAASSSSAAAASASATHKGAAGALKPPSFGLITNDDRTIMVWLVVGLTTAFGFFSML